MDLAADLRAAGVEWSIDCTMKEEPSRREGRAPFQVHRLRVRLRDLNVSSKDPGSAKTPPVLETLYSMGARQHGQDAVDHLLALALRDLMPNHPVYASFIAHYQGGEVDLRSQCFRGKGDYLGEALHTAMRNGMDSPQSAILYSAQMHLMPEDWSHILQLIRDEVKAVADAASAESAPLHMRKVAMAMKRAMVERLGEVHSRGSGEPVRRKDPQRTAHQAFALFSFEHACKATSDMEWLYGWAPCVCTSPQNAKDAAPAEADEKPSSPEP